MIKEFNFKVHSINKKAIDILIANSIVTITCEYFGITTAELMSKRMHFPLAEARQYIVYFINKYTDTLSGMEIKVFVNYSKGYFLKKIIDKIQNDIDYGIDINRIRNIQKSIEITLKEIEETINIFIIQ